MANDTLSDVLRAVRLTGAVFFNIHAAAPWVAEIPPAREVSPYLSLGVEHVIEYHVLTAGSCWGGVLGERPSELAAGDIIIFPQGDAHVLSSTPGMRGVAAREPFTRVKTSQLPVIVNMDEGGGPRVDIICGFLGCDARPFNPLLATLPRAIVMRRSESEDGLLEHFVKLALSESMAKRPGGDCVLARLSELLFVEAIRRHVASLPPEQTGWLAGLRDPAIGRVLTKLHERPAHDWSLDELARECGMSRSVLAERFAHFVGVPAMQYLAQWRMQLAATLLTSTSAGLADIAEQVGYGSEGALSRAFKRWVGVAPADWRRGKRAETAGTTPEAA